MEKKNFSRILLIVFFSISIVLIGVVILLTFHYFKEKHRLNENREVAIKLIHGTLENGNIDLLADKYLDPNIEIIYPEEFHLPPLGTNTAKGRDIVKNIVKAWKADTSHKINIVDAVSEENTVVILARTDRVFNLNGEIRRYKNSPLAYFFTFKDEKITKVEAVFDVITDVEAFKKQIYQFEDK